MYVCMHVRMYTHASCMHARFLANSGNMLIQNEQFVGQKYPKKMTENQQNCGLRGNEYKKWNIKEKKVPITGGKHTKKHPEICKTRKTEKKRICPTLVFTPIFHLKQSNTQQMNGLHTLRQMKKERTHL